MKIEIKIGDITKEIGPGVGKIVRPNTQIISKWWEELKVNLPSYIDYEWYLVGNILNKDSKTKDVDVIIVDKNNGSLDKLKNTLEAACSLGFSNSIIIDISMRADNLIGKPEDVKSPFHRIQHWKKATKTWSDGTVKVLNDRDTQEDVYDVQELIDGLYKISYNECPWKSFAHEKVEDFLASNLL
ncbi:hypothetical protein OAE73_00640 [bacterium]|nr:hypothetical protein [bacterium]